MTAKKPVFIGIDPTSGRRPIKYAILNERLVIEALEDAPLEEVVETVTQYPSVVCAVNAPIGPNKRLLLNPDYRQRIGLEPERSTYSTFRVCEYELRRRGISIYNTPPDLERVTGWMKEAWQLFDLLREAGFVEYPRPGSRRMLETHPHAAYTALLQCRPYSKTSIEGRLQRQLILYQEGVEVPDPMYILEELTHHRLLTGQLNMDDIHEHDELDTLVAAYIAFLVEREPHEVTAIGDPTEGQIILPTTNLLDSY